MQIYRRADKADPEVDPEVDLEVDPKHWEENGNGKEATYRGENCCGEKKDYLGGNIWTR